MPFNYWTVTGHLNTGHSIVRYLNGSVIQMFGIWIPNVFTHAWLSTVFVCDCSIMESDEMTVLIKKYEDAEKAAEEAKRAKELQAKAEAKP